MRKLSFLLLWPLAGWATGGVVESAREIPVTDEVDVLVVGGTAAGVAAATAAAEKGATVYLAGGFTYLGEDMAGTLELECATGDGATELERKLRRFEQAYAHDPRGVYAEHASAVLREYE